MKTKALNIVILILILTLASCGEKKSLLKNANLKSGNFLSLPSENCMSKNCLLLRKEFDYVISTGKKIYCYWDLKKAVTQNDYIKIAADLKNTITDSTTTYEYYLTLRKWAASFQDGHVNVMWGKDMTELEYYEIPVSLELLAPGTDHETLIVASNSATTREIPVGAVVTKINDVNAMEQLGRTAKSISGSTIRMQRMKAAKDIFTLMNSRDEEKAPVKIEYTFNKITKTSVIPRFITIPYNTPDTTDNNAEPVYSDLIQAQILPNNIGYLRVDSFDGSNMTAILERTLNLLSNTKALVIDMRKNGGGNQSANAILSFLTNKPISRYHVSYRVSDLVMQERTWSMLEMDFDENDAFTPVMQESVYPSMNSYKGKVYILTSPRCFSACDTFVSAIKENQLGVILGEGTAGGTGSPYNFELIYSGLSFRYSVVQGFTAVNKTFIEGTGTLPDIEIFPSIEERISGEDLQLVAATNIAAQAIGTEAIDAQMLKEAGIKPTDDKKETSNLYDDDQKIKAEKEVIKF